MHKKNKKTKKSFLNEAEPINRPESMADFAPTDETPISLDQAIDRYFIQYERESIPTSEIYENKDVNGLIKFLFEQDLDLDLGGDEEPVDEEPTGEEGEEDLGFGLDDDDLDSDEDSEQDDESPQPVMNTPQLNMQDFARSVARLTNNVEALIDIKSIILNRAKAYIKNNYNERTAVEMMNTLDKQWNLKPVDSEVSATDTPKFPQPTAGVTGPIGG